jgi:hypothetical protein
MSSHPHSASAADERATRQPTATLVSDIAQSLARLVQGELMLARAEMAGAARKAVAGVVKVVVAVVLAFVGLNVLAGAAVAALASSGMGAGAAALVVGLVLLALAAILVVSARAAFGLKNLMPRRSLRGLSRDAEALRAGFARKGEPHV